MPPRKAGAKPQRRTVQPRNLSRAAGAPAPASAAATAPFYAGDEARTESPLRATFEQRFAEETRAESRPLERGGSVDREVAETLAADNITDAPTLEQEIARIRATRRPLGAFAQKLALPVRPGYHRHWFNDVAGRVQEAADNGWAHVLDKDRKPLARCVGTGRDKGALYAYAMEIPEVFWQEDQDARNQAAADKMQGLKNAPFRSAPGQAKPADKGEFYDPTESEAGPISIGSSLVKG
jgi:hypothetical protein